LYILIFIILDSRLEDKKSGLNGSKHYPSLGQYVAAELGLIRT
jgi:hypothetical protein